MKPPLHGFLVLLILLLTSPFVRGAEPPPFYLKGGDTVVFYGDSITEQSLYNQWVELYTVTRFPKMRVHFYGAGVGGDRVSGGSGGTIDERLSRDVFPHRPSVITVMLGMNDGSYRATTDEIQSAYINGYEHLIQAIHEHAPGARVTIIGPSPLDDVTRPFWFPGGYNLVMQNFAELDRSMARKSNSLFVNFNPPVVALLQRAKAFDPQIGQLIIPDRVHPELIAHLVMAETLLDAWNAPAEVSSVVIDAHAVKIVEASNASVDALSVDHELWRWNETESSLPIPFEKDNATQALLLKFTDVQDRLNQERLRITGLEQGQYGLKIDEDEIGTFPAEQLDKGINLADFGTPMHDQAQRVAWLIGDRERADSVHIQMLIRKADVGCSQGSTDLMDLFENELEDAIYQAAVPKSHVYRLNRVSAPAR